MFPTIRPWCYIFVVVVVILLSVDIFLFFILCRVNRFTLYFLCWEGYILRSKGKKKKQHTQKHRFSICSSWSLTFLLLPSVPARQMSSSGRTLGCGVANGACGTCTRASEHVPFDYVQMCHSACLWAVTTLMGVTVIFDCRPSRWAPALTGGEKCRKSHPWIGGGGGWEACTLHKAHNLPRQDTGGGVHCTHFQFEFQHWLVGGSNFQLLRRMIKIPQCTARR